MNAQVDIETAQTVDRTEVIAVENALVEFDRVSAGLAALRQQYAGVVFPVETKDGMEAARAARKAVREPRFKLEALRQQAKAPILALGRRLDSEARRIEAEIRDIEDPIDLQITTEEQRIEDEKRAKAEAETRRVNGIRGRIEEIRRFPQAVVPMDSATAREALEHLKSTGPTEAVFAEFLREATEAHDAAVAEIARLVDSKVEQDAEAERLRQERAQLEAQRTELSRIAAIRERIGELHGNQMLTATDDPELIMQHVQDLRALAVDDSFQEFRAEAELAKAGGLARLMGLHDAAMEHAESQARLRAEQEALAEQRRQQEAADLAAREELELQQQESERIAQQQRDEAARLEQQRQELAAREAALAAPPPAPSPVLLDPLPAEPVMPQSPVAWVPPEPTPGPIDIVAGLANEFDVSQPEALIWLRSYNWHEVELS